MNTPLVITHANCQDGHCCKWLLSNAFPSAEFHDGYYGQSPPKCDGRDVIIADFSYKKSQMCEIYAACNSLVVLDHHKTAQSELEGFGGPKATVVFDMHKSGGRLAWEWLMQRAGQQFNFSHLPKSPWLVDYSEDRDLWRWELENSREIDAVLRSTPKTVEAWNELMECFPEPWNGWKAWAAMVDQGAAILRAEQQIVDSHVRNAREEAVGGYKVKVVNATTLHSDIAGQLAHDRPFGVCWFQRQDGLFQWSLRSRDGGIDVSEVAKQFGGGGHHHASGFQSETLSEILGH